MTQPDPKGAERPTPQHWKSARMAACRARRQGERNDFVNLLEYFEDTERQRDALRADQAVMLDAIDKDTKEIDHLHAEAD